MVHKKQIFLFDDVISEELCNKIRSLIIETEGKQEKWEPGQNVRCKYITDHPKDIDDQIYKIVQNVVQLLVDCNPAIKINGDSGYQLREIYGETRLHYDGIDVTKGDPRCMSLIIALNDDYEGGEIYFPNQEYKIKLKRGQAIAFPPYWTHPHGVNTPLNGTLRYTINTWLLE